jgi:hypothetical protein
VYRIGTIAVALLLLVALRGPEWKTEGSTARQPWPFYDNRGFPRICSMVSSHQPLPPRIYSFASLAPPLLKPHRLRGRAVDPSEVPYTQGTRTPSSMILEGTPPPCARMVVRMVNARGVREVQRLSILRNKYHKLCASFFPIGIQTLTTFSPHSWSYLSTSDTDFILLPRTYTPSNSDSDLITSSSIIFIANGFTINIATLGFNFSSYPQTPGRGRGHHQLIDTPHRNL